MYVYTYIHMYIVMQCNVVYDIDGWICVLYVLYIYIIIMI